MVADCVSAEKSGDDGDEARGHVEQSGFFGGETEAFDDGCGVDGENS